MIFSDQKGIDVIVHLISMRIENLSRAAEADNRFIAGGEIINMGGWKTFLFTFSETFRQNILGKL